MKIGIDCRTILNPSLGERVGAAHYTYYLVKNLLAIDRENKYVLFFPSLTQPSVVAELVQNYENVKVKFFPFYRYKRFLPLTYSQLLVSAVYESEKLDLLHLTADSLPYIYSGKSAVTVHDLAIFKYPQWFPSQIISNLNLYTKVLFPKSLKHSDKIIAVSENTKKDLIELFKIPTEKIKVIYEGTGQQSEAEIQKIVSQRADSIIEQFKINRPYLLFLGTIEPRKNLILLVRAFGELLRSSDFFQGFQLVIAGAKGYRHQEVFREIKKVNQNYKIGFPPIKYVGYVDKTAKYALMSRSACFVFPTLYEGFGLPIVEAMSLGAPVITSKVSSIPEITEEAAILIDPASQKEMTAAISRLLKDKQLQEELRQSGFRQSKKFSWRKCAEETLKLYESIK